MKRLAVLLIFMLSLLCANPIDDYPTIFELQILEPDSWIMEINGLNFVYEKVDSIVIESLEGKGRILECDTVETDRGLLWILTQENLSEPLEICIDQDLIKFYLYFNDGRSYSRQVKIGDYPGSYLHDILPSQSIVYDMYESTYYKSDSPSFGEWEFRDIEGKIYGYFYDKDGTVIKDKYVKIYRGDFITPCSEYIDSTGYYKAKLGSKFYSYNVLYLWYPNLGGDNWHFKLNEFDLEPGDSIQVDFYASQTGITPVIQNTIKLNNYPHPTSTYTWFFIENTDAEASQLRVNVYALNGRKVDSFIPSAKHFRYDCSHLPQGSYVLSLQQGNEVLASKKLQVVK